MGIRLRTLISLGVSFFILFTLIVAFSNIWVSGAFSDLEEENIRNNFQKVLSKFDDMQSDLGAIAGDWAYWDDTYLFMQKLDSAYIDKNLNAEAFINSEVDFIIFFDKTGGATLSKLIKIPDDKEKITTHEIIRQIQPTNPPGSFRASLSIKKGFVKTKSHPALIAMRPILKSDGSGPIEGAIAVGLFLDNFELKRISEHFGYDIIFEEFENTLNSKELNQTKDDSTDADQIAIHPVSKQIVESSVLIRDINDNPSYLLIASMSRPFHKISKETLYYYSAAILLIGFLFTTIIIFMLEKQVLSPIINLCSQIESILTLDDLRHRTTAKGSNEFKKLSNSINIMLENLSYRATEHKQLNRQLKEEISERKKAEKELRKSKEELESIVEERTCELKSANIKLQQEIKNRKMKEKERRELQDQLQRAQKMEAIGTLAGGIAHDFNNLLMAIQGNISIMLLNRDSSDPEYETLKLIEKRIIGGAELTAQLLGYAQKGKYENKPIDINHLIQENIQAYSQMRKDISIKLDLCESLCTVKGDRGQLESVLLNLFANASDAMPNGGSLFMSTEIIENTDITSSKFKPERGRYVKLTITDTGIGIDLEEQDRIFDPFFTTKEMGRGTGLGLSSVYGIVKHHNGYIDVSSKKDKGTSFYIYLPLSSEQIIENNLVKQEDLPGRGGILVVDDEELVLSVAAVLIEKLGYTVFKANSGEEAIEQYRSNKENIDLVILDMIMPDMNGEQTFEKLKELDHGVNVLISTGFSIEGRPSLLLERGCKGVLQKPFTYDVLSGKIKEILQIN